MMNLLNLCRSSSAAMATALVVVLSVGCERNDRPSLGRVHGVVTVDGEPVEAAKVQFSPSADVRGSMGVTDDEGRYELVYIRDVLGAAECEHTVRISAETEERLEFIPAKYNTQSELMRIVEPGENEFNFQLITAENRDSD